MNNEKKEKYVCTHCGERCGYVNGELQCISPYCDKPKPTRTGSYVPGKGYV